MPLFTYRSEMPASSSDVFSWHGRPGAFERLVPPWEKLRIVEGDARLREGGKLTLELRKASRRIRWEAMIQHVREGESFRDVQIDGPFARWEHTHSFKPVAGNRSLLEDEVDYELPLGILGRLLGGGLVRRQLARTFRFRHEVTRNDLERWNAYAGDAPLRIAVTGSSGLVGSRLTASLSAAGHQVVRLVRRNADPERGELFWDPSSGKIDSAGLEGVNAVVHLAGANVGAGRWSPSRKAAIRSSRILGTKLISEALATLERKPRVLISSSAVGYYGNRGNEPITEESDPGDGFLSSVCRAWEDSTAPARDAGIRVVNLRTGIVLTSAGGPLAKMLPPFQMGVGGVIGDGNQYMSWIALEDLIGIIGCLIHKDDISGPVNAVSPNPATNREFTKTLSRILGRPAVIPLPGFAVRLLFGEMGETLLLEGAKVLPARLEASGYLFSYPDLPSALRLELGRWPVKGPPAVT
jgi:uncharacterized protein (TIGR01777 family)